MRQRDEAPRDTTVVPLKGCKSLIHKNEKAAEGRDHDLEGAHTTLWGGCMPRAPAPPPAAAATHQAAGTQNFCIIICTLT